jgi:hypothetical protein
VHCEDFIRVLSLDGAKEHWEHILAKKSKKKSTKKKISAREFNREFTRIIGGHLVTLPGEEQDKRIRSAHRVVVNRFRGASSTRRGADETRLTPLAARTRE